MHLILFRVLIDNIYTAQASNTNIFIFSIDFLSRTMNMRYLCNLWSCLLGLFSSKHNFHGCSVRSPRGRNYEIMTKPLPGKNDEQHHEICQHIVYVLALVFTFRACICSLFLALFLHGCTHLFFSFLTLLGF